MNAAHIFAYYWKLLRRDELLDFFSEGLGIAARHSRSRRHWRPHLELSKEFQIKTIHACAPEARSVVIIGAGRLFDVPVDFYRERQMKIALVDADPGCATTWNAFRRTLPPGMVTTHVQDVTGTFFAWTESIAEKIRTLSRRERKSLKIADILNSLADTAVRPPALPPADVVVSLNVLGQLAVYWRQRLHQILLPLGIDTEKMIDTDLEMAIAHCCSVLENQHAEQLAATKADLLITLCDDEYYYYERGTAPWQVERALQNGPPESIPMYLCSRRDSWLWHIAPQGIENKKYGAIHRVQARAFVRK